MLPADIEKLKVVAEVMLNEQHVVALTGAGISVESGIPDFRSPGGLWEKYPPMEYATIDAFLENPHKVWEMFFDLNELLFAAQPNAAHLALAKLEQLQCLDGIITQNVDNLHQAAGAHQVVEFHGNGRRLICTKCGSVERPADHVTKGHPPTCKCGAVLKPDVVLFGEMIPERALIRSTELVESCRVMLIIGTSASVAPASLIPMAAKRNGATLVEFNLNATEATAICDVFIQVNASESLPLLAERVEAGRTR